MPATGCRPAAAKSNPPSGTTSTKPQSAAEWLMMAASRSAGASSRRGVTRSSTLSPAVMKPECSATPTPSMATSTMPSGGNSTKVFTIRARNCVSAAGASWFTTRIGADAVMCPAVSRTTVPGSVSVKATGASNADTAHTASSEKRKSTTGSGSRLPSRSRRSSQREEPERCSGGWVEAATTERKARRRRSTRRGILPLGEPERRRMPALTNEDPT